MFRTFVRVCREGMRWIAGASPGPRRAVTNVYNIEREAGTWARPPLGNRQGTSATDGPGVLGPRPILDGAAATLTRSRNARGH